jgi:hypothetical protein
VNRVRGAVRRFAGARHHRRIVISCVAAVICGAAPIAVNDAAAQTAAKTFLHPVKPKGIAEECFRLTADASIGYTFEASAPVDFNIHFHRGDIVEYPVRVDQASHGDDRFTAGSTEEYCLMWTNRTAQPVTIRGALRP